MDLMKESMRISMQMKRKRQELEIAEKEIQSEMEANLQDLREAAGKGDTSENAAFTTAVEKVSDLTVQLANVRSQISEYDALPDDSRYVPIGMAVTFSTVLLSVNGKEMLFKLYPGGVSSLEDDVMAADSRVGKALWRRKAGDKFTVIHRVTGEPVRYEVLDLY